MSTTALFDLVVAAIFSHVAFYLLTQVISCADFHRGEIHKLYALIVRTTLGRPFVCNVPHPFRRPPCAEPGCRSLDSCTIHRHFYDSVVGSSVMNQNTHREFVVYDPTQCLPEFIVTYSLWPANAPFTFK